MPRAELSFFSVRLAIIIEPAESTAPSSVKESREQALRRIRALSQPHIGINDKHTLARHALLHHYRWGSDTVNLLSPKAILEACVEAIARDLFLAEFFGLDGEISSGYQPFYNDAAIDPQQFEFLGQGPQALEVVRNRLAEAGHVYPDAQKLGPVGIDITHVLQKQQIPKDPVDWWAELYGQPAVVVLPYRVVPLDNRVMIEVSDGFRPPNGATADPGFRFERMIFVQSSLEDR